MPSSLFSLFVHTLVIFHSPLLLWNLYWLHQLTLTWLWIELCPLPPNSYVEALTSNVTVFGDWAFTEIFKVKWGHKDGALIQYDWCPCKKRKRHQECRAQRKGHVKTQGEGGCLQAKERDLRRILSCQHHDLGHPASRTVRKLNFCCLSYSIFSILLWLPEPMTTLPLEFFSLLPGLPLL